MKVISLICIFYCCCNTTYAELVAIPAPPAIAARAWLMQDFHTGKVLAQRNIDTRLEPASLTKVMTAYVVLSKIKAGSFSLQDEVTISEKAWKMKGARMFVKVNTQVQIEDLLRGLIIQSGNDAAVALAEYVAGSEEAFAELMNEQAARLGMRNTHFENATGWPHEGHYTTAADLMVLANALIRDLPEYYVYYSEKSFTYNGIPQLNRNTLLWKDESVDGIKTGYTDASGYSLLSSSKRGDMRLVTVLLGAKNTLAREKYTRNLLDFAYRFYDTKKLFDKDRTLKTVRVWKGREAHVDLVPATDVYVTIPRGFYDQLEANMQIAVDLDAPVVPGVPYGKGVITLKDKVLKEFVITSKTAIAKGTIWKRIRDSIVSLF